MNKQELREMIAQEVTAHTPPPPPVQRRVYSILDCDVPFVKAAQWIVTVWCAMIFATILIFIAGVVILTFIGTMTYEMLQPTDAEIQKALQERPSISAPP